MEQHNKYIPERWAYDEGPWPGPNAVLHVDGKPVWDVFAFDMRSCIVTAACGVSGYSCPEHEGEGQGYRYKPDNPMNVCTVQLTGQVGVARIYGTQGYGVWRYQGQWFVQRAGINEHTAFATPHRALAHLLGRRLAGDTVPLTAITFLREQVELHSEPVPW